jgi:hypothetical protein
MREFWYVASYDVRRLTLPWNNSTIRKTLIFRGVDQCPIPG